MKKPTAILLTLLVAAIGLSACGLRVKPSEPEGKIQPSRQY